ncbi:MAG: LysR family transcriptional regulator [Endozoicomonas sp.]
MNSQKIPSHNLDLNLLKVFVIVYQEKKLKRAAQRLSLTAPSVSVKLSKLRERVGGELFFKTPTGFEPTALADKLFERVEPLLAELSGAVDFLDGFDPGLMAEPLIIDIGQNLMPWLSPALHEQVLAFSPESHLVANYFTESTIDRLRKGEVSMGIQMKIDMDCKDILEIPLGSLEMGIVVRKGHPYPYDEATVEDLASYDFAVLVHSFSALIKGGPFLQQMEKDGIDLNIKFRSPSEYAVCEVLKRSDMVLPSPLNLMRYSSQDLRAIKIVDYPEFTQLPFSVYLHQKHRHSEKHRWLLELIRKEFQYACDV